VLISALIVVRLWAQMLAILIVVAFS